MIDLARPSEPGRPAPAATPVPAAPPARPVLVLGLIALPTGWVLLSLPIILGLPAEPFVLGTLVLGLVVPAVVLTYRESGRRGLGALARRMVRPPRPRWWLIVALLAVPVLTWVTASVVGGAVPLTVDRLVGTALTLLSSLVIVNLAEEGVWMGFAQHRLMARSGLVRGSLVAAGLFAGIHLPLAFADGFDPPAVLGGVALLFGTAAVIRLAFGALYRSTGDGVLVIAVLHAAYNAAGDLVHPGAALAQLAALVLVAAGILGVHAARKGDPR